MLPITVDKLMGALSKSATESWLNWSECALFIFGLILVVGLVGEHMGIKWRWWKGKERAFSLLVMLGVMGELLSDGGIFGFGRQLQVTVDREVSESNRIAAQANQDAKEAGLKIAKLEHENLLLRSGTREISEESSNLITAQLKLLPPLYVKIERCGNSYETLHLVLQLLTIFQAAGSKVDMENWPVPVKGVKIAWKSWHVDTVAGQPDPQGNPMMAQFQISIAILNQVGENFDFFSNVFTGPGNADGVTNLDCNLKIWVGENR